MELIQDFKYNYKEPATEPLVKEFGLVQGVVGDAGRNLSYIHKQTKADIKVKPHYAGIQHGITITIRHANLDGIKKAEFFIYKLLDKVKGDFDAFKKKVGIKHDDVKVSYSTNTAICGVCQAQLSCTLEDFEIHVKKHEAAAAQGGKAKESNAGVLFPAASYMKPRVLSHNVSKASSKRKVEDSSGASPIYGDDEDEHLYGRSSPPSSRKVQLKKPHKKAQGLDSLRHYSSSRSRSPSPKEVRKIVVVSDKSKSDSKNTRKGNENNQEEKRKIQILPKGDSAEKPKYYDSSDKYSKKYRDRSRTPDKRYSHRERSRSRSKDRKYYRSRSRSIERYDKSRHYKKKRQSRSRSQTPKYRKMSRSRSPSKSKKAKSSRTRSPKDLSKKKKYKKDTDTDQDKTPLKSKKDKNQRRSRSKSPRSKRSIDERLTKRSDRDKMRWSSSLSPVSSDDLNLSQGNRSGSERQGLKKLGDHQEHPAQTLVMDYAHKISDTERHTLENQHKLKMEQLKAAGNDKELDEKHQQQSLDRFSHGTRNSIEPDKKLHGSRNSLEPHDFNNAERKRADLDIRKKEDVDMRGHVKNDGHTGYRDQHDSTKAENRNNTGGRSKRSRSRSVERSSYDRRNSSRHDKFNPHPGYSYTNPKFKDSNDGSQENSPEPNNFRKSNDERRPPLKNWHNSDNRNQYDGRTYDDRTYDDRKGSSYRRPSFRSSPSRDRRSPGRYRDSPSRDRRSPGRDRRSPGRDRRSPGRDRRSPPRSRRSSEKEVPPPVDWYPDITDDMIENPDIHEPMYVARARYDIVMKDYRSGNIDKRSAEILFSKLLDTINPQQQEEVLGEIKADVHRITQTMDSYEAVSVIHGIELAKVCQFFMKRANEVKDSLVHRYRFARFLNKKNVQPTFEANHGFLAPEAGAPPPGLVIRPPGPLIVPPQGPGMPPLAPPTGHHVVVSPGFPYVPPTGLPPGLPVPPVPGIPQAAPTFPPPGYLPQAAPIYPPHVPTSYNQPPPQVLPAVADAPPGTVTVVPISPYPVSTAHGMSTYQQPPAQMPVYSHPQTTGYNTATPSLPAEYPSVHRSSLDRRSYSRSPKRRQSRSPHRSYSRSPRRRQSRSPSRHSSRYSRHSRSPNNRRGYSPSRRRDTSRSPERRSGRGMGYSEQLSVRLDGRKTDMVPKAPVHKTQPPVSRDSSPDPFMFDEPPDTSADANIGLSSAFSPGKPKGIPGLDSLEPEIPGIDQRPPPVVDRQPPFMQGESYIPGMNPVNPRPAGPAIDPRQNLHPFMDREYSPPLNRESPAEQMIVIDDDERQALSNPNRGIRITMPDRRDPVIQSRNGQYAFSNKILHHDMHMFILGFLPDLAQQNQVVFSNTALYNAEEEIYSAKILLGVEMYDAPGQTALEAKKRVSAKALMQTRYRFRVFPEKLMHFNQK